MTPPLKSDLRALLEARDKVDVVNWFYDSNGASINSFVSGYGWRNLFDVRGLGFITGFLGKSNWEAEKNLDDLAKLTIDAANFLTKHRAELDLIAGDDKSTICDSH